MIKDSPTYPALIGMPRSASRMTWQILKFLCPNEKPADWYPELNTSSIKHLDSAIGWPVTRHAYFPTAPVIYTYRHPVEAYLSLLSRVSQDIGKEIRHWKHSSEEDGTLRYDPLTGSPVALGKGIQTADSAARSSMAQIGSQWEVYKKLCVDVRAGREVLFLKYEDFYHDDESRVATICQFMNIDLSPSGMKKILKYVNIEANAKRGSAISKFIPESTFDQGGSPIHGMQRGHVNVDTMGRPNAHLECNLNFLKDMIIDESQPAYTALKEMCREMGYNPGDNRKHAPSAILNFKASFVEVSHE